MKVLKWLDNNLEQAITPDLLCGMTIVMGGRSLPDMLFQLPCPGLRKSPDICLLFPVLSVPVIVLNTDYPLRLTS
mgnify:CR=1 FL=1